MPDRQKQTVKRGCYPIKGRRYTRENVIDKIISAIADYIQIELIQITPVSVLSFPGLEIIQRRRQVLQGGEEVKLTRLEQHPCIPCFQSQHCPYNATPVAAII